jgi:hypothetical protein
VQHTAHLETAPTRNVSKLLTPTLRPKSRRASGQLGQGSFASAATSACANSALFPEARAPYPRPCQPAAKRLALESVSE